MSDINTAAKIPMPRMLGSLPTRTAEEYAQPEVRARSANIVAALEKDLNAPDASLERLAELLVELKVRPYRDMCADLKSNMPDKVETPEAIMLWLHDWAERQLKARDRD